MDNKFHFNPKWTEYELCIINKYGFNQLSISEFIDKAKDVFLEKGFKKVLDLGCGNGNHSIYFSNEGFDIYASDIDCRFIKENLRRLNIITINVCEHSFTSIPYESDFFDAVICTSTIHHAILSDIKKGINEIYRVLNPDGYFVFDILSKEDLSYGLGTEIEDNTFVGSREGEENIPHHYTDEKELELLLNAFSSVEVNKSIFSFTYPKGTRYTSKVFEIIAIK